MSRGNAYIALTKPDVSFLVLITTAAGLTVAIPSLIAYRYLRGRVERIVVEMEKQAMRMADAVESSPARERAAA